MYRSSNLRVFKDLKSRVELERYIRRAKILSAYYCTTCIIVDCVR